MEDETRGVSVVLLETGVANTGSVSHMLKRLGAKVTPTQNDTQLLKEAEYVVVPGVGSFGSAMDFLEKNHVVEPLKERVLAGKPTLFICVGMQILARESEESPGAKGLDLLPGCHIIKFPSYVRVPQQCWNVVKVDSSGSNILPNNGSAPAYFSNSYCLPTIPLGWHGAYAHHGIPFLAAIEKGSVLATQFHPELSGEWGLALVKRWLYGSSSSSSSSFSSSFPSSAGSRREEGKHTHSMRRVIPCLDVCDGRVVKGVKFQELRDSGDPVELAVAYEKQGADEIVMLDITATNEKRKTASATVAAIKAKLSLPLTVGGGIGTLEDAGALLASGADKVSVNTAAVQDPSLITKLADHFGSQCTVVAIDAVETAEGSGKWEVVIKSGKEKTGMDVIQWATECVKRGAGEILLTSFDRDGTKSGYDLGLITGVSQAVSVPVIASGGAKSAAHMADALKAGADAVLAASIFHEGETTVHAIKQELLGYGIGLRDVAPKVDPLTTTNAQCFVPSIDIMNGHAVQLVGGDPTKLKVDAGDPLPLALKFRLAGEIAVVDLDAALGTGDNSLIIKQLLKVARCRVGGGIRTVEKALDYLNAGAAKVVIGTSAKPDFLKQLPRDRVVVALDARHGEVVVEGWKTKTGRSVKECIAELKEFASGFLVTFVEREGQMAGIDIPAIRELVDEIRKGDHGKQTQLTIAGGVTTLEDLRALDALGVEGQVGMALYTGRMDLGDAIAAPLKSDRSDGLYPTIVVDEEGSSLGLAYSSNESIRLAVERQQGIYQSRNRGIWIKGETSGATQDLLGITLDCDRDTIQFTVRQHGGGFCHRDSMSCFGNNERGLKALMTTLQSRLKSAPEGSYTKRLFDDPQLLKAKILEEAEELTQATTKEEITAEAADVIYFTLTACAKAGITLKDVGDVLDQRALKVSRRPGNAKPGFLEKVDAKEKLKEREKEKERETKEREKDNRVSSTNPQTKLRRITPEELPDLRREPVDAETRKIAEQIVSEIRDKGEEAFLAHAIRLGDLKKPDREGEKPEYIRTKEEMRKAYLSLDDEDRKVLDDTAGRIRTFARAQRTSLQGLCIPIPGGEAGHTIAPVEIAGCYAPGGRYPLPSSVLMTGITAREAGCSKVWVASPNPQPITLAAAYVAGADGLLAVGGAQAIAGLTYGIGPIPPCDAVVGPGNKFVTAAKSLVAGRVAIDMLAGPSECLVLVDHTADPATVAADLLAQAEHDVSAVPILVSLDESIVGRIEEELHKQLDSLPTAAVARVAVNKNGFVVVVDNLDEAAYVCNQLAPEHLEVHTANPERASDKLRNYGALFIGHNAAEVMGDYGAGPNHTLPTGGTARSFGGLSVLTFMRVRTWLNISDLSKAQVIVKDAVKLAELEGLIGHANAARRRLLGEGAEERPKLMAPTPVRPATESPRAQPDRSPSPALPLPKLSLVEKEEEHPTLRFALPKGRMMDNVMKLLEEAGVHIVTNGRNLRATINIPNCNLKLLKPRNVVEMLHHGTRDIAFAGTDLLEELHASNVVPYFNTGLDPVKVVVAAPESLFVDGKLPRRHLRIATEYVELTKKWIAENDIDGEIYKTYGSTEVFPPDDADIIVDNTATGTTLKANQLVIIAELFKSSTHVCVHKSVLQDRKKRLALDELVLLLKSALNARDRVLIEFNVATAELLDPIIAKLPALKRPTVSSLYGGGFAVRSAIPRKDLVSIIPLIKDNGGTDVIVSNVKQIIL